MGFCLVSNIAVVAASLAAEGERVWVLDYDAHHGNGTQAVFETTRGCCSSASTSGRCTRARVGLTESGAGAGMGTTMNLPMPAGTTGDVYLRAFDEVIAPVVERFAPTWLLISAGFDAHRDDPLAELGLTAGDFSLLTRGRCELVPARPDRGDARGRLRPRRAVVVRGRRPRRRWPGVPIHPEAPSAGGPGGHVVDDAAPAVGDEARLS